MQQMGKGMQPDTSRSASAEPRASLGAVVTAGGRLDPSFAQFAGTDIKALIKVKGRPLIYYPLCALSGAPSVGRIVVVGPREALKGQAGMEKAEVVVEEVGTAPENILAGFRALGEEERVVVCASDIPHITTRAIESFLAACPEEADVCYAVVRNEIFERQYPGVHHMKVPMREGIFTGGSIQLMRPAAVERNLALINRTFAARKSKLGMVRLLGLGFVVKFLLGSLSIREVEERAAEFTGCVCRAVVTEEAGLAFDVDRAEQVELAERGLEEFCEV